MFYLAVKYWKHCLIWLLFQIMNNLKKMIIPFGLDWFLYYVIYLSLQLLSHHFKITLFGNWSLTIISIYFLYIIIYFKSIDYYFSNVVNLLTNVPPTCLDQLLIKNHWCEVDALKVIINFLDTRLSSAEVYYSIV